MVLVQPCGQLGVGWGDLHLECCESLQQLHEKRAVVLTKKEGLFVYTPFSHTSL